MGVRRKKAASASAPRSRRSAPRSSRKPRGTDAEKKTVALLTRELDETRQHNVHLFEELQARTLELLQALEQQRAASEVRGVIATSPGELEPVVQAKLPDAPLAPPASS